MNVFLFVNPLSGRYDPGRIASIVNGFKGYGLQPTLCEVRTPRDVPAYCHTIHAAVDTPLVIIAAGDGTVNAVINNLLPGRATVAVLPLGTSNVLAAEIGICSVEDGIKRIIAGRTRSLPVGLLELENVSHRFLLMAGIGIDGAVVRDVRPFAKRHLKQGAYALSAGHGALNWDHTLITLCTPEKSLTCHSVVVCAASRYGGNFILAPECDLFSPVFTIVCVQNVRRRDYLRLAINLFSGRVDTNHDLFRIQAREAEILGRKPIQIDGDFVGYSPARLRMVADFAHIIV
ncbi:MAG: diacylglycerol kinase family lipid kinase [Desulfuromonadales bacterium]|nr:diacylglycerol kinase family lipid kinase [Desulfuromonadales bacterium]